MREQMIAMDSLTKGESADSKGINAEDIKGADEETITVLHEIFNLITKQNSTAPSSWKKGMITVIYKKRDATNPENCRPICGLPQLHKLFSTMPHSRLHAELDWYQCPDQAGFRKNQTTDRLMTYRLISQKSREWGDGHHLPEKQRVGGRTCGWQRSTSRRHSIHNMQQSGDVSEIIRSVNNTFAS